MCGIAAIVAPNAPCLMPEMRRMLDAIVHRGPDAHGVERLENCLLGHRRLSIIDPVGGAQPMRSADGTKYLVFNGELYDYKQTRRDYDYPFRTNSDTELIFAAYEKYGDDLCGHLKGMFAFALWDGQRKKLVCGRDRFGEKPLYYAFGKNGKFIVASEIKAIIASGLVNLEIDHTGVSAYLRMGFVPEGQSVFREIRQLRPGHALVYEEGKIREFPYWRPPAPRISPLSLNDASERFSVLMKRAVERCLVSDVEVGILLSGGLDSTTVAALAAMNGKLRCFSFGMAGARNELPYAQAAAAQYGLPLEESRVADMDFPALLTSLPEIYDEPLADTSCLPTLMLCRHVAGYVKTAIGGDGGDELLGGYNWYQGIKPNKRKVTNGWTSCAASHFERRSFCRSDDLREAGLAPWYPPLPLHLSDSVDDAMRMDIAGFLPSDILKKTDRAAMRYGLELRSPFLDADLAEFLIALPAAYKINDGQGKLLLREVFGGLWPVAIRNRPKQGFGMKTADIMARLDVAPLVHEVTGKNSAICGLLPHEWVSRTMAPESGLSWAVFILALWCEAFKKWKHGNVFQS